MGARPRPFLLFFEMLFLESYSDLGSKERNIIPLKVLMGPEESNGSSPAMSASLHYPSPQCFPPCTR